MSDTESRRPSVERGRRGKVSPLAALQRIQLAVEDVNGRGGAGGHPLETLVLDGAGPGADTLSRQRATVASYERFVADPAVIAVIGPQTSAESRAVAPASWATPFLPVLTGLRSAPIVRGVMQARDAGQTGFFGYYFSYRLPGGPMP